MEESPTRKPYKLDYVDNGEKEEQTQFVFIILITIFVVIIICCIIEVYRTDRAHKKRVERETDESIIWAKEQATKMHESSSARLSFKSIASDHDNEAKIKVINEPTPPLVGILKNGSAKPNVEYDKPMKDHPTIRGKLIDFNFKAWVLEILLGYTTNYFLLNYPCLNPPTASKTIFIQLRTTIF